LNNGMLLVFDKNKKISMLRMFNKKIKTEKGFNIGDNVQRMKELYGEPDLINYENNGAGYGEYVYKINNLKIGFDFDLINGYRGETINCINITPDVSQSANVMPNIISTNENEIKKTALPIFNNILNSLKNGNYQNYVKDFYQGLINADTEKSFRDAVVNIKNELGDYISSDYLGFLNQGSCTLILWKVKFNKYKDDVAIKMYLSKYDNNVRVVGFWYTGKL
jgi:hypothetical protein